LLSLAKSLKQIFITTHQNVPFTFVDSDAHGRARVPNKSAAHKYEITLSNAVKPAFVWLFVWLKKQKAQRNYS